MNSFVCSMVVIRVSCVRSSSPREQLKQKRRKECELFKPSHLKIFYIKIVGSVFIGSEYETMLK